MKDKRTYFLTVYEAEEGGYWAIFPDFEMVGAQGETIDELIENAKDGLYSTLEYLAEKGKEFPRASGIQEVKASADKSNGEIAFVMPVTVYSPAKTERFNLTASGDKLAEITDYAKNHKISRSELMVNATIEYIRQQA